MATDCSIEPLSEDALLVRFGDRIDATINARVHAATRLLRETGLPGVTDVAPAYATLLIRFDPDVWRGPTGASPFTRIVPRLRTLMERMAGESCPASEEARTARTRGVPRSMEFPVCYGGEYGPDLDAVARHAGLSRGVVIARHAAAEYTVAMLGFAPGFPYLLGLDPGLHAARRAQPRTRVPAGSVAIGGAQTGIYPSELPGGWNLIGRTPLVLFDPLRNPPCLLAPGGRVRFRSVDRDEFARLAESAS